MNKQPFRRDQAATGKKPSLQKAHASNTEHGKHAELAMGCTRNL